MDVYCRLLIPTLTIYCIFNIHIFIYICNKYVTSQVAVHKYRKEKKYKIYEGGKERKKKYVKSNSKKENG